MTLSIAATLYSDSQFRTKCALAMANYAKNLLLGPGTLPPLEEGYAKTLCRDPSIFSQQCTAVMLNMYDTLHATATPTDSVIVSAATAAWPALIAIQSH